MIVSMPASPLHLKSKSDILIFIFNIITAVGAVLILTQVQIRTFNFKIINNHFCLKVKKKVIFVTIPPIPKKHLPVNQIMTIIFMATRKIGVSNANR